MFRQLKDKIIGDQIEMLESLHDRARYTLLFNIASSVLILGLLATIVSLIIGTYPVLVPGLGNVLFSLIALTLIKRGKLQLAAKIYFFVLFILLFGNLNLNDGTMHIGSPLWIMILNILVIYIMGIKWGIGYLIASTLGFAYYIIVVLPHTLEIIHTLPSATYYSVVYETVFAMFLLGYTIYTILSASRTSDKMLRERNSALRERNQIIQQQNQDKTVMLKEIHHRVKNNLQVIISLMRLQMDELECEKDHKKFNETINRVLTMAMIHEKLYQSEELSKVNIEYYFKDLSTDLIASYQLGKSVKLNTNIGIEQIGMKALVPIALIFNELFSNSLKHAFEQEGAPVIDFALYHDEDNSITMTYRDNGTWKLPQNSKSFGTQLVKSLVGQLEGEMKFESEPATSYTFIFKDMEF